MTTATALVARTPAELALAGPIGSFDAYADTVSRIPVLSREDEQELAVRYHRDGDLDAARQLVLSHLRFVLHIARGYAGYGLPIGPARASSAGVRATRAVAVVIGSKYLSLPVLVEY